MQLKTTDIEKINAYSRKKLSEDEVYIFTVSLCNNDIDRDYEKFSVASLKALAPMFIGKTGIFDHSMKSADQKARIFDTYIVKEEGKKTADGEDFYVLKARAYMLKSKENKALIDEIEAGIKKEVSVSCSMGKSVCSVCKKDKRKQSCPHKSGKMYDGELAFSVLEEPFDAYEFSFVAVPAQREAGVTKSFKKEKEPDMQEIIKTIKACDGEVTLSKSQSEQITALIDKLTEEAELGERYKKELSKEVAKLLAIKLPDVDSELFNSIVSVMTVKELIGFKDGLKKGMKPEGLTPQLAQAEKEIKTNDYSQFRI
ncbi:MAG: hypothetical protein IJS03_02470 [Eubacterium sp.]|nr:hypothetical protein [Eubacterium sp.]